MRIKHVNKLIFVPLKINSLSNKFGFLGELLKGKVDILTISEIEMDERFPLGQFNSIQDGRFQD